MKPILFSTPMVQAILDGRKTMTRRVIKSVSTEAKFESFGYCDSVHDELARFILPDGSGVFAPPKCVTGDILWVRETWRVTGVISEPYAYKADEEILSLVGESGQVLSLRYKWRPSIFMPREACRIYLRVTEVRAERLQDISEEQAVKEGVRGDTPYGNMGNQWTARDNFQDLWNSLNAKPKPQYETIDGKMRVSHYVSYPWEDVQETSTWRGKPWYVIGNPWVWVIEFERCEKPEAADA